MSSRTPLTDEIRTRRAAIGDWIVQKTQNIGNYHPISQKKKEQKEKEEKPVLEQQKTVQEQQTEDNEKVKKILGPDAYEKLHKDTPEEDSTEARIKFIQAISDRFGHEFFAQNRPQKTRFGPASLEELSALAKANGYKGKDDLKALYEAAVQEERNSRAYKNAVFLRSIEVYEHGNFGKDRQKVMLVSGASGSGKTSVRPDIVHMQVQAIKKPGANPAELTENQHLVVTVDGGIEREVSQIRDIMNQTALDLGYGGIDDDDLDKVTTKATKGEKLKKTIEDVANSKNFHLAIPTTTPTKELKKYMKKKGTDVSYVIVENTREVVSFISRLRAFAKIGKPIPKDGDKKPESKKPGGVLSFMLGTFLAHYGAYEYAKKQKALKKEPVIIKVTKNLVLVKPKKNKKDKHSEATSFIPCSKKDPDCVLMTQAQLEAWTQVQKKKEAISFTLNDGLVFNVEMPGIKINDWPLKEPSETHYIQAAEYKEIVEKINEHIKNNNDKEAKALIKSITKEQLYSERYVQEYLPCKEKSKEGLSFVPIKSDVPAIKQLQIKQAKKLVENLESGKLSEKKARLHLRLLKFHTAFRFIDLLKIFKSPNLEESLKWPSSLAAANLMIKCLDRQEALLKDLKTSPENKEFIFKQLKSLKKALPKQQNGELNPNMKSVFDKITTIEKLNINTQTTPEATTRENSKAILNEENDPVNQKDLPPPPLPPTAAPKPVLAVPPVPSTTPKPATALEPYVEGYPPKPQRRLTTDKMRPLSSVLLTQVQENEIARMHEKATIMTTNSGDGMKKLEYLAGKDPVAVVNAFEVLQMAADKTPIEYILEISGNELDVATKNFAINQLMNCGDNTKIIGIAINDRRLNEGEFKNWVAEAQAKKSVQPAPVLPPHNPHPI